MEQLPRVSSGFGQGRAAPLMLQGGREGHGAGPLAGTGRVDCVQTHGEGGSGL